MVGSVAAAAGDVPRVSTELHVADRLGTWKARWAIGRMHYAVGPGLYAVGDPTSESPVLVSANYKMSFDRLRSQLGGLDAWILVLDTRGINVWCAAGKGTFSTGEIVRQVEAVELAKVVTHRRIIVPQLGAPGVAAHEVSKRTGFRVVYGPVRAEDLPDFLGAGEDATAEMRRVRFPIGDRLAVVPVELVMSAKPVLVIAACLFALGGLGPEGYSWQRAVGVGRWSAFLFVATCTGSAVAVPALLPWLPGRAFSVKGVWVGLALFVALCGWGFFRPDVFEDWPTAVAWFLAMPAAASFIAMNFTGASTYTSLSGVRKEMAIGVPVQAVSAVLAAGLWLVGRFV